MGAKATQPQPNNLPTEGSLKVRKILDTTPLRPSTDEGPCDPREETPVLRDLGTATIISKRLYFFCRACSDAPIHWIGALAWIFIAGDHLISHTLTRAVPSAQRGLTSVFGMGTGVTLAVWSPANLGVLRRLLLPRVCSDNLNR